jgi:hypothetical protein
MKSWYLQTEKFAGEFKFHDFTWNNHKCIETMANEMDVYNYSFRFCDFGSVALLIELVDTSS